MVFFEAICCSVLHDTPYQGTWGAGIFDTFLYIQNDIIICFKNSSFLIIESDMKIDIRSTFVYVYSGAFRKLLPTISKTHCSVPWESIKRCMAFIRRIQDSITRLLHIHKRPSIFCMHPFPFYETFKCIIALRKEYI